MDLSVMGRALRQYWWIVVASTVVALAVGVFVTIQTPASYQSTVTFSIRTPDDQVAGADRKDQWAQRRMNSYMALLSSDRLGELVRTDTQLPLTADDIAKRVTATSGPDGALLTATVTDAYPDRSLIIATSVDTQFVALVSALDTHGGAAPSAGLDVTTAPTLNATPVSPEPLITMGAALGIGLAMGFGLALLYGRRAGRRDPAAPGAGLAR